MNVKEISYGESVEIGGVWYKAHLVADVYPHENLSAVQTDLVNEVKALIDSGSSGNTPTKATTTVAKPKAKAKAKPTTEEAPAVPTEEKKPAEKKPAAEKKAKAPRKKKPVGYNREVQDHKKAFASIVAGIHGKDWFGNADVKAKAGELSQSLNGTAMFDGDSGDVLSSFEDAVKEGFASGEEGL